MSELTVGTLSGLSANNFVIDVASGSKIVQPGAVLQVVSTTKTDSFTTSSTSPVDVTNLEVTITPSSNTSKILVSYSVLVGNTTNGNGAYVQLKRDSTDIAKGTDGSVRNRTAIFYQSSNFEVGVLAGDFLDTPNTTSPVVYKIAIEANTSTAVVNRRGDTTGDGAVSTITVMEVAG